MFKIKLDEYREIDDLADVIFKDIKNDIHEVLVSMQKHGHHNASMEIAKINDFIPGGHLIRSIVKIEVCEESDPIPIYRGTRRIN